MTTEAYTVQLDFDPADIFYRLDVIKHAQTLPSFLHIGLSTKKQKITVMFTDEQDALMFRLKWTK